MKNKYVSKILMPLELLLLIADPDDKLEFSATYFLKNIIIFLKLHFLNLTKFIF